MFCRDWECSHSIRSEILLRYWCSIFSQLWFLKKKSVDLKNLKNIFWSKMKISKNRENFQKRVFFSIQNSMKMLKIFEIFRDFFFDPNFLKVFFRSTDFFFKNQSWKKFRNINIEVKFQCGSNGSTPSLWKPLQSIVSGR